MYTIWLCAHTCCFCWPTHFLQYAIKNDATSSNHAVPASRLPYRTPKSFADRSVTCKHLTTPCAYQSPFSSSPPHSKPTAYKQRAAPPVLKEAIAIMPLQAHIIVYRLQPTFHRLSRSSSPISLLTLLPSAIANRWIKAFPSNSLP